MEQDKIKKIKELDAKAQLLQKEQEGIESEKQKTLCDLASSEKNEFEKRIKNTNELRLKIIEVDILAMTANFILFEAISSRSLALISPAVFFLLSIIIMTPNLFSIGFSLWPLKISNLNYSIKEISEAIKYEMSEGEGIRFFDFNFNDWIAAILFLFGVILLLSISLISLGCLSDPLSGQCIVR